MSAGRGEKGEPLFFFLSFFLSYSTPQPPQQPPTRPWLILLSPFSYLSPACRLSSASTPASFLLCCPADCATQPTLGVGGMAGTLNLLMQPFVAIASELAAPLPGRADRCSKTLPQLSAIGYLLLLALSVYVCALQAKVAHKYLYEHICHMHQATHIYVCAQASSSPHKHAHTVKENKEMSLIFSYSYHMSPSFLLEFQYLEKQL